VPGSRSPRTGSTSKQAAVIALLTRPQGTTVAEIMQITGWQQHSVRGFLAGVVRKRLDLKLECHESSGERNYRIVSAKGSKPEPKHADTEAA
jgi:hypothetical protein